jgi:DNA-binding transcriptional MerR regulator
MRTLRFYDRTGLLVPSQKTDAGYRMYTDEDLARLQQVLALKFLGFSLDEIKRCLANGPRRLQESLGQQKAMMREKRAQLDAILQAIEQAERRLEAEESTFESVVRVIEVIQMQQKNDWVNKYFTPEQQQQMQKLSESAYSEQARQKLAARGPWTEEDQKRAGEQWAQVGSDLKRLVATGADPTGAEAQAWAKSFDDLISAFTQNDPEVEAGLRNWWKLHRELPESEQPVRAVQYSAEEQSFMDKALSAYRQR